MRTLPAILFLIPVAATTASAQCPAPQGEFDLAGVEGIVEDAGVFDLGNGPELYLTGFFDSASGGTSVTNVARWSGTAWHALGNGLSLAAPGPSAFGLTLELFDDGGGNKLYAGGRFDRAGGVSVAGVAAWDGQSWQAVGSSIRGDVADLAVFDEGGGRTLWAAAFEHPSLGRIYRWDGVDWVEEAATDGWISSLVVFDDGSGTGLFVGGVFDAPYRALAKWNGSAWLDVGGGLSLSSPAPVSFKPSAYALTVWDDGSGAALFVGGEHFDRAGSVSVQNVARWRSGAWSAFGSLAACQRLQPIDLGSGSKLYSVSPELRVWDGVAWTPLAAPPVQGFARALTALDRGNGPEFVVAGEFLGDGWREVASWAGGAWNPFGAPQDGMHEAPVDLLAADTGQGERLFALTRGDWLGFQRVAGAWDGSGWTALPAFYGWGPGKRLLTFESAGIAHLSIATAHDLHRITNGQWTRWAQAHGTFADFLQLDLGGGPQLYACGSFHGVDDLFLSYAITENVAAWDGTAWSVLGGGLTGPGVHALAAFDDGSGLGLYAGGQFASSGATALNNVARWDGASWHPLGNGVDGRITSMATFDGGLGTRLYVAGELTSAGGSAVAHIAAWDGLTWSPVGSGIASNGPTSLTDFRTITDMVVFDDGTGPALYVGGDFHDAGGTSTASVARWDGTSWSALGSGATHPVTALEVFDDGAGDRLFVGGHFIAFDGLPAAGIAKWGDRCALEANVAFCQASDAACPCGNGGDGAGGCDTPQATGGVRLELASLVPGSGTSEVATLRGSGFPASTAPAVLLLRAGDWSRAPAPFGDGLACLGGPSAIADVRLATSGSTTHVVTEQDGTGVRYYQLRYRSNPAAFCDATAAFNTSNAFKVTW